MLRSELAGVLDGLAQPVAGDVQRRRLDLVACRLDIRIPNPAELAVWVVLDRAAVCSRPQDLAPAKRGEDAPRMTVRRFGKEPQPLGAAIGYPAQPLSDRCSDHRRGGRSVQHELHPSYLPEGGVALLKLKRMRSIACQPSRSMSDYRDRLRYLHVHRHSLPHPHDAASRRVLHCR